MQNVGLTFIMNQEIYYFLAWHGGEGNGSPLQYSCLENPVDGEAWWPALHGFAQSQTRLKRFSMHACIGEGNNDPLQCSCLENPRDRGAWWAAVMGSHRVGHDWSDLAAAAAAWHGIPKLIILTKCLRFFCRYDSIKFY